MTDRTIPRATYRLQLTKDFPFRRAAELAPYLGQLGISHVYTAPILKARPGSTHGYDTVDHSLLNPDLGSIDDFRAMAAAFRAEGIGLVVDFVPNHMGIGGAENPAWLSVLEWGKDSPYAHWFDINWHPSEPTLDGKVLVPFLGAPFEEVLIGGDIALKFDTQTGSFAAWAYDTLKLPINPHDYGAILQGVPAVSELAGGFFRLDEAPVEKAEALKQQLTERARDAAVRGAIEQAAAQFSGSKGDSRSWDRLRGLAARQHWRAADYHAAADELNYRRFFVVSDLAGLRIEADDVFDAAHKVIFGLIAEGLIEGLRIDHIDGLSDPQAYCQKLRQRAPRPIYLVVEKIVAPDETVPPSWGVEGTTGYEFANLALQLVVDPASEKPLSELYADFTDLHTSPQAITRQAKIDIMDREMATELDSLSFHLVRLSRRHPESSDLTRNTLRKALREIIASLPVYRTYVDGGRISDSDRRALKIAAEEAHRLNPTLGNAAFKFLYSLLSGELDDPDAVGVVRRIQQYSGPVMAKGLEDTALYRVNRLIALNDVGARPEHWSASVDHFHHANRARAEHSPYAMLTTSSHDTKRGEDARARIAAITGHAEAWQAAVRRWHERLKAAGAPHIESNDEYYFYQTLLGSWPPELAGDDTQAMPPFAERVQAGMLKAVREARVRTDWSAPQEDYEAALHDFIELALADAEFLRDFRQFENTIARDGALNGLIITALKLTVPGVPDTYQGAELWEQSLVDPDNRRVVDFDLRQRLLNQVDARGWPELLDDFRSGAVKLKLIRDILHLRTEHEALFRDGSYEAIATDDGRVCAFQRTLRGDSIFVAAQLYPWRGDDASPLELPPGQWRDILTGKTLSGSASLFDTLPVSVLVRR